MSSNPTDTMRQDTQLFQQLREQIRAAGCMRPAPFAIGVHMTVTLAIYLSAFAVLLTGPEWPVRLLLLAAIAFASVQGGYIAHETGHYSFTRNARLSKALAEVFLTFLSGYGHAVYKGKHTTHHAHINESELDPDVSGGGLLSFHKEAAQSRKGFAHWITRHQKVLVWLLYGLVPLAAKRDSVIWYLGRNKGVTTVGRIALALHFALWFCAPMLVLGPVDTLINFVLAAWLAGPYLGAVVLLNHIGTVHLSGRTGMSHFRRALLTTRNFRGGRFCTYLTGGTNHHLEHHLFPTVPVYRLAKANEVTRQFCGAQDLPYRETSWYEAQKETLAYLDEMSRYASGDSLRAS